MHKSLLSLFLAACLFSCSSQQQSPFRMAVGSKAEVHNYAKITSTVSSEAGQALLGEIDTEKYDKLKKYWVPQKKNFCGVCSAVITINTSRDNNHLTQRNLFDKEVKKIILPETVSKIGLTLRELHEIISTRAKDLKTYKYPSHTSGLDLFRKQLKENDANDSFMIVNFSRQSLAGTGMRSGHFSIVAGYHEEKKQVFILEVNGDKESFWVADKDLFTAMKAIDPVSQIPRGWVITGK